MAAAAAATAAARAAIAVRQWSGAAGDIDRADHLLSAWPRRSGGLRPGPVAQLARVKEDLCLKYGCLVIVNELRAYKVMEMRVEMTDRKGGKAVGPEPARPAVAGAPGDLADQGARPGDCELPVRFTLRESKGREECCRSKTRCGYAPNPTAIR